ncbi:sulfotransferase [Cyclobacterium qasimii]|uniref:Sulfotransferase domain-containing protein n=2 Tax=Cyclobacterium qasimii TaxID=1350429 RepID=S7WLW5_9BACT|nr:sulfotransferase [Cyclobacterium qasimii]EPR67709.1 hypothetical protein ADICYQ_3349 [Cyclobacterium qasimii M12-11B]GEO19528.1 hypothetical protein CQA01_00620 [Cyclobacterium qasimii]
MTYFKGELVGIFNSLRVLGKPKIFCIGFNKTGTTSLKILFRELGFVVGAQHEAEFLLSEVERGKFDGLFKHINKAQFFQDYPFSVPNTYKVLDEMCPSAKFILSVRDSPDAWYKSLVKFHSLKFNNGNLPTVKSLKENNYIYKGWIWEFLTKVYGFEEDKKLYNKEDLTKLYINHNEEVKDYFKGKKNKLIVINLQNNEGVEKLYKFINIKSSISQFPWENKSKS